MLPVLQVCLHHSRLAHNIMTLHKMCDMCVDVGVLARTRGTAAGLILAGMFVYMTQTKRKPYMQLSI